MSEENDTHQTSEAEGAYWRENIRLLLTLMAIWFACSFGAGILFRDFLRCNETVRLSYEQIKRRLARIFPENIDGYLYIKDPLMDIIFEGAEIWARETSWVPDSDFL